VNGTVYGAVNAPTVRVVGPVATMAVPPAGTTASAYTFRWSGADGASRVPSYDIRYRHAYFSGNFSPWASLHTTVTSKTLGLAEGYDYCMQVRARSVAGDVGACSPARCIARVLDDKALGYSSGWTRRAGSSYYDGSALVTTAAGRTLTRTGAVVERIGVLATTCSTCGKVGVYVGGTLVGSVNLAASSTHYRTLLYVSRFSLRSGSVVLKTLTSNKLVQVDGLLLSRT
jgi:hypothetical protein